jgi:Flp pilus assembly protein TadD
MRLRSKKHERELAAAIECGRGLIREQKDQEALEFLEKAAREFPQSPEIPLLLATVYRGSRPDDISAQLAKASDLGSDDPVIQVMVGHRLLNEGDVEAARACAARVGDLIDDEFALRADLDRLIGRIAARDGDYVVAEARLRAAFRGEPELSTHSLDLARFLWARRRNEDALTVINESLDRVREPGDKDLLERLRGEITDEV